MQRGELMTPLLKVINLEKHPWYAMNCMHLYIKANRYTFTIIRHALFEDSN